MPTPFDPVYAHHLLAETIYGRPGVETNLKEEYLQCNNWEEFFRVDEENTKIFVNWYEWQEPFEEVEPYILKNLQAIVRYAVKGIRGRWPDGEAALLGPIPGLRTADNLQACVTYAKIFVAPGRWPEFEQVLLYATKAPKMRSLETARIMQYIYSYLRTVAQSRVDVADAQGSTLEEYFITNGQLFMVIDHFLKLGTVGDIPDLESKLAAGLALNDDLFTRAAVLYCLTIKQARWIVLENSFKDLRWTSDVSTYVNHFYTEDELLNYLPR